MLDVLLGKGQKSGKSNLRANVDDTAMRVEIAVNSGTLNQKNEREPGLLKDIAPTRGTFSNVAVMCEDSEVQVLLPQFIVARVSCFDA